MSRWVDELMGEKGEENREEEIESRKEERGVVSFECLVNDI